MCEPTTIALGAAALAGGAVLSSAMAPSVPKVEPTTPQQPQTKQNEKAANVDQLRRNNSGNGVNVGPGASTGSTLLTGPGGIDSSDLSLNKNTLLGG
ncbi:MULTISPECIES: hypothetical protein [Achromobacter]|uniref:hypothetical protein n=1 Tax=Achromobacter TaxID=222 RepID=UPI0006C0E8E2|nr:MULTISPECIES: hypothetical protein [Achromobacter]CUJ71700.1 Uncharacterised protein [Achromobacter sp. 2789STDY5608628]CUJ76891.1 Uncharacterised protein [Achromobacter sp. 2789STDY5608633]CUK12114.1 Uncharacterised protein [Achromobacter sp. 2789STDY5608615]